MKKVLFLAFAAVMTSVVISSCSHDDYNGPTTQDPSVEKPTIDSFIEARGLSMVEDIYNPALMYEIDNYGDTVNGRLTQDSAEAIIKLKCELLDGTVIEQTGTDTTAVIDFVTQRTKNIQTLTPAFIYFLNNNGGVRTVGKGAVYKFVTPSAYAFGPAGETIGTTTIPPNSPLYYEVEFVDRGKTSSF